MTTCIVWGNIYDASGSALQGKTVRAELLDRGITYTGGKGFSYVTARSTTTDGNGYWALTLTPSAEMTTREGKQARYTLSIPELRYLRQVYVPSSACSSYDLLVSAY